ncbi:hypothetical protein VTN02DRAFT_4377 [Thermoascus thermophilus]
MQDQMEDVRGPQSRESEYRQHGRHWLRARFTIRLTTLRTRLADFEVLGKQPGPWHLGRFWFLGSTVCGLKISLSRLALKQASLAYMRNIYMAHKIIISVKRNVIFSRDCLACAAVPCNASRK